MEDEVEGVGREKLCASFVYLSAVRDGRGVADGCRRFEWLRARSGDVDMTRREDGVVGGRRSKEKRGEGSVKSRGYEQRVIRRWLIAVVLPDDDVHPCSLAE